MKITRRKKIVSVVAAVTLAGGATAAWAAWSANTTGNGEAVTMIAQAITLTPSSTGSATMYPGGPAATIYFTMTNPNPYAVNFTTASYSSPVSTSTTTCPTANVTISPSAPTTVSVSLAAGATSVAMSIPGVLQLSHSAPDGCQGVGFLVNVQLLGSQA